MLNVYIVVKAYPKQNKNKMEKKNYIHDCDHCTFLGNHSDDLGVYDLYFCPQGLRKTVIARYGDRGSEYLSGIGFKATPPLAKAEKLALEAGLLTEEEIAKYK